MIWNSKLQSSISFLPYFETVRNLKSAALMASPESVSENVRDLVKAFKPGGGFVFNQVHNIMGNVPPENIVAMLDTAYQESFYQDHCS